METEPTRVSTKKFAQLVAAHTREQIGAVFDAILAEYKSDHALARFHASVGVEEMWTRVLVICLASGLRDDLPDMLRAAGFGDECVACAQSDERDEEVFLWAANLAMMEPNGLSFEKNVPIALSCVFASNKLT